MTVRLGVPQDYESIRKSNNSTNALENSAYFPNAIREDLENGYLIFDDETHGFLAFYPTKKSDPPRVTIYNIYVPKSSRKKGSGFQMVEFLRELYPDRPILAKCPVDIESNKWYEHTGWKLKEVLPPEGRRKRALNLWVYEVSS